MRKEISFAIAFIVALGFLWLTVFNGDSIFNLLPFQIHESFNPGGQTEGTFIVFFDCFVALGIMILGYLTLNKFFGKKRS